MKNKMAADLGFVFLKIMIKIFRINNDFTLNGSGNSKLKT